MFKWGNRGGIRQTGILACPLRAAVPRQGVQPLWVSVSPPTKLRESDLPQLNETRDVSPWLGHVSGTSAVITPAIVVISKVPTSCQIPREG